MNNKEIKALMTCNDILTKECAKLRNENEELKNRLSTIAQQPLSGSPEGSPKLPSYRDVCEKMMLDRQDDEAFAWAVYSEIKKLGNFA